MSVNIPSDMNRYQLTYADNLARALNDEKHNICMGVDALKTLDNISRFIDKGIV